MPFYNLQAVAYDKDGKRLSGNAHKVEASSQSDAIEIAKGRQSSDSAMVRVEVKVISVSDKN